MVGSGGGDGGFFLLHQVPCKISFRFVTLPSQVELSPSVRAHPLPWLQHARNFSAPNPLSRLLSVAIPIKKRVLEGSIVPPPTTDTQMMDYAEADGHQPEPTARPPTSPPTYNPADVVSDLSAFVSDMLGHNAGSTVVFPSLSFRRFWFIW